MIQCKKCGGWAPDGTNFCPTCGTQLGGEPHDYGQGEYSAQDIQQNKILAVFSYIGFLFLIPLLACRNSRFARFHANQGIVLFISEVLFNFCLGVLRFVNRLSLIHFSWLISLLNAFTIVFLVLSIWGIVNVCTGKAVKLPILGEVTLLKY